MNFQHYVELKGSHKRAPQADKTGGLNKRQAVSVSILLRPKAQFPNLIDASGYKKFNVLRPSQYKTKHGAQKADVDLVTEFAYQAGLAIKAMKDDPRIIELHGSITHLENAFQCELENYSSIDGKIFRGRSGSIGIPKELENIVQGVFGLDDRAVAFPKFQLFKPSLSKELTSSFFPNQLADVYNFPSKATGKKQCIGIIELGGGYREQDISNYFSSLGIKPPNVVSVSVDGGFNDPSSADSADGEVMLDIEVAGAVAPDASLAVYFAPNTDKGFLDAISTAIHDLENKPDVISISWGSSEDSWTAQSLDAFNSLFQTAGMMGISICAAAGDRGSSDGVTDGLAHVDFPSSSPFVVACGGTRLITKNNEIENETVWHESDDSATGGGVSSVFDLPSYQEKSNVPVSVNSNSKGRGVPDVAANADPATGYKVLVDGNQFIIGGTSAVAPLIAGLIARVNQVNGKNLGFFHHELYGNASACRDIIKGDNITTTTNKGYVAKEGWDACTGLGAPIGTNWLKL
jgi:kumamolisin